MRRPRVLLLLAAALIGLLLASPAFAQDEEEGETIGGRIITREEGEDPAPVEGVTLTVRQDGEEIGQAETDENGEWSVPVPGAGAYQVELDEETLPDGVTLRDPDRNVLDNVVVRGNQKKVVLFPLGEGATGGTGAFEELADLAANGLKLGSIVALAAVGLSLIFGVTGLVNFAHGELVTFGGIVAWWFNASGGGPGLTLVLAAILAVAAGCLLGGALELGLWRPLRNRRMGAFSLMVVSIGLSILLRHLFLLWFGAAPEKYADYVLQRQVDIGPVSMVPKDIVVTLLSLAVLVAFGLLLKGTRIGTGMRAVSDNRDLAESSGIDVRQVILVTWVAGAGLAGLGGILFATSQNISWDTGFTLLLTMFAAVILGGLGSAYGAMAGGLVIGVVAEVSTYWLDVEFKVVTGLVVLIAVLLVRPQGLLGIRERIG